MQMSQQVVYNAEICIEHPVPRVMPATMIGTSQGNKDAGSGKLRDPEFRFSRTAASMPTIYSPATEHCPDYGCFSHHSRSVHH